MSAREVEVEVEVEVEKEVEVEVDISTRKNGIPFLRMNFAEKTRGKHANCPCCEGVMKRIYMKFQYCKRSTFRAVGWVCLDCYRVVLDGGVEQCLEKVRRL